MSVLLGAIEAGGTKFVCVVARDAATILAERRVATTTPAATLGAAEDFFATVSSEMGALSAIGIASFGPLDIRRSSPTYGHLLATPKPGWANADLAARFATRFACPVVLDTDVNAAALAEALHGAARGCGVVDIGAQRGHPTLPGLVPPQDLDRLVESIHVATNGSSRLATGAAASNLDLYQVNCTFYDALARVDGDYLLARAIQFFAPGIPQVYYVGLLAGHNDVALLRRTGVGRDINRHYYPHDELDAALQRPVVRNLCALIRLRNTHPAFGGKFSSDAPGGAELVMRWRSGADFAELRIDFASRGYRLLITEAGVARSLDLTALADVAPEQLCQGVVQ